MRRFSALAAALLVAAPLTAQQGPLTAAASTRATAVVTLSAPRVQGQPAPPAFTIKVDYGQPHARGRNVPIELGSDGTIWRTGANASTTLTTDVDLVVGGANVPKGAYSIFTIREGGRYFLIINQNTGQWGTQYDAVRDLVRVPLRARTRTDGVESMQIALVPVAEGPASGVLSISWGTLELSTDWSTK